MKYLILCSTSMAKEPYYFEFTNTRIYSIEELCYYIYNNIYIIDKSIFTKELAEWIGRELDMEELKNKLIYLIENEKSLKDIMVTIMCSADYYFEEDIKELIRTIDKIDGLPTLLKKKIKADRFLQCNNYAMAGKEYNEILVSDELESINNVEQGNILHNLAIVKMHTSNFTSAAQNFKEAYIKNKNIESLKQYLYTIKISGDEEWFRAEIANLNVSEEVVVDVIGEYAKVLQEAYNSEKFVKIARLGEIKKDGRVSEYYDTIEKLVLEWKKDYKREQFKMCGMEK